MLQNLKNKALALSMGAMAAAVALPASAAVDVTAVVTEIEGAAAPIAAIGGATLIVFVGLKVFKWVRRAF